MNYRFKALCAALLASASFPAVAQEAAAPTMLPEVNAETQEADAPAAGATLGRDALRARQSASSDTARLLADIPGVAVNTGGGFAGMPTVRGLSEQRLSIMVDGFTIDSACPNDMNAPLSYTDPQTVGMIRVITGVSPVSMGGDSIGAIIAVNGPAPRFASQGATLLTGELSAFYRSNGDAAGSAVTLTAASQSLSATYTGSFTSAGRYSGGGDLGIVRSSEYRKTDHALALAYQGAIGLIELKGGYHYSPYEGFVNQYMDMTMNRSWFINGHWHDDLAWGSIDLKADYRAIDHEMNFLADKGGTAGGGMPMNTRVRSGGYNLKLDVPVTSSHTLRLGNEYHREAMNDWWPAVAGSMMMGPNPYLNVTDGRRTRLGFHGEAESRWSDSLTSVVGVRMDRVTMNAGQVQPYATNMMNMDDAMAAAAFNARDHRRVDNNWSASGIVSYTPAAGWSIELGYAHKARSPNLYERFTWGRGTMSSSMIGWYGDGNGYVGNLDLKPERADTLSLSVQAGEGGDDGWFIKAAPYYTHVNDYIDGAFLRNQTNMMGVPTGFVQLRFANTTAEFYGLDLSAAAPLWDLGTAGKTRIGGSLSWVHGENTANHVPLYHQMPLEMKLSLTHKAGGLEAGIDLDWVSEKNRVDTVRKEPQTRAFALLNLRLAYEWKGLRLSADVENLLDKAYALPLGGMSLGDYRYSGKTVLRPVPGAGRSLNLGISKRF